MPSKLGSSPGSLSLYIYIHIRINPTTSTRAAKAALWLPKEVEALGFQHLDLATWRISEEHSSGQRCFCDRKVKPGGRVFQPALNQPILLMIVVLVMLRAEIIRHIFLLERLAVHHKAGMDNPQVHGLLAPSVVHSWVFYTLVCFTGPLMFLLPSKKVAKEVTPPRVDIFREAILEVLEMAAWHILLETVPSRYLASTAVRHSTA